MAITPEEFIKGAEEKAPEQQWRHRWFTTIIPCGNLNEPLVCNYCPNCRAIYTQAVAVPMYDNAGGMYERYSGQLIQSDLATISKLDLPKNGCEGPEGI
jgi:hypothetical protein